MKTNKLWAAAGVLLFLFALSCTDTTKDNSTNQSKNSSADDSSSLFEEDSVTEETVVTKMYSFPAKKDSIVRFWGSLNDATDTESFRVSIYYSKAGKKPHKKAVFKIKGKDKFQYNFSVPDNGKMHLVIEQERKIVGWKNLSLIVIPPPNDEEGYDEWCNNPIILMFQRKDVKTDGGTGDGVTVKTTQP